MLGVSILVAFGGVWSLGEGERSCMGRVPASCRVLDVGASVTGGDAGGGDTCPGMLSADTIQPVSGRGRCCPTVKVWPRIAAAY